MLDFFLPVAHAHSPPLQDWQTTSPIFVHNAPFTTLIGTLMVLGLVLAIGLTLWLYFRQRRQFRELGQPVPFIQKAGWCYSLMFYAIAALAYTPGMTDGQGTFANLFQLDTQDDLLHLGSGLWAMLASWHSVKQATLYFRLFGTVYFLDGVVGLTTQRGFLDLGLWMYDYPNISLAANIGANAPHILIGGIAIVVGFFLSHKGR